jgi:hypothetical protein
MVEESEAQLKEAKEKGYNSINEYWQKEMPETDTARTSRVKKGIKLMSINDAFDLKKSKVQFDFGIESPEAIEKAIQVKGFTRTRKGKMERVKPHSREIEQNLKEFEMLHAIASEYNKAAKAEKLYGKDMAAEMKEMHTQDAKDLSRVHMLWMKKDYDGAYNLAADTDTAARDNIPAGVWKDIKANTRNLGEPYKTVGEINWVKAPSVSYGGQSHFFTSATPKGRVWVVWDRSNKMWKVDVEKVRKDDLVPTFPLFKTPEEGKKFVEQWVKGKSEPVGEPFQFIAEHQKASDKWETNLAGKLGSIKDKMKNKQPVSNKELNDLISEAEDLREFKTRIAGEPYRLEDPGMFPFATSEVANKPSDKMFNFVSWLRKKKGIEYDNLTSEQDERYLKEYEQSLKIGEPVSVELGKQIAKTILLQMGGAGKIKMMTGAKNFMALPSGVSFDFPNKGGPNHVKITLEPDDTYTVEFGRKAGMKALMSGNLKADDFYKQISKHTDIYFDQLKELFEGQTGLYLSFNKSVTSGEKYVVSLEKSKGPWKKGKQWGGIKEANEIDSYRVLKKEHSKSPLTGGALDELNKLEEKYGGKKLPTFQMFKSKGGFRMARGGSMGEEEKASAKKEQGETGEKTQAQERLSGYAKRRKEELGPPKNADNDNEGGDSEEMAI